MQPHARYKSTRIRLTIELIAHLLSALVDSCSREQQRPFKMSSMKRSRTCSGCTDAQVDEAERPSRSPALKIRRTIRTDDLSRLADVGSTCSVASPQCDDARRGAEVALAPTSPHEDAEADDMHLGLPICDEPETTRSSVDAS